MNNQEYEQKKSECWEEYTRKCVHESKSAYGAFDFAFDRAYTLGKQDKDAYAVIQGWVARDMNDNLYVYCHKPKRNLMECLWEGEIVNIPIYNDTFPELTWESEPQECEIIIKRKKKNL